MKITKTEFVLSLFFTAVLFTFAGYLWAYSHYYKRDNRVRIHRELEMEIKHYDLDVPFWIAYTDIKLTPWKDGSYVLRIEEEI